MKITRSGFAAGIRKSSSQLFTTLFLIGLVAFIAVFVWQSFQIKKMQTQVQQRQEELAAYQERNDSLQQHLDFYKSPGYMLYVEKVSREALGLAKPGETVVLTVPVNTSSNNDSTSPKAALQEKINPVKPRPSWQNWFGFFFGPTS